MWMILTICLLAAPPEVQVSTLAGAQASGALVSMDSNQAIVRTTAGEERFEAGDLLAIKIPSALPGDKIPPAVWIELVDGSLVLATHYTTTGGLARAQLLSGESIDIPTRSIRSVRLQSHDSELARQSQLAKQWRDILATEPTSDVIIVRKVTTSETEDGTPGKPTSAALDELTGVLGDVTDDKVQFTYEDQQIPVARTKVEGIVYFHPSGRELPEPLCRLDDVSGSRWNVKLVALSGDTVQFVTTSGVKVELPIRKLKQLDYSAGKIVYLSDLEPETSQWTNYFGTSALTNSLAKLNAPRRDASFDGGPIIVAGKSYEKGLALHSRTLLEYRLQGKFSKFTAIAALEDKVRATGNVKLAISLDGKLLGEYELGAKQTLPLMIAHDISRGRKLSILVDYGEGLDVSDRLHLANARVTK